MKKQREFTKNYLVHEKYYVLDELTQSILSRLDDFDRTRIINEVMNRFFYMAERDYYLNNKNPNINIESYIKMKIWDKFCDVMLDEYGYVNTVSTNILSTKKDNTNSCDNNKENMINQIVSPTNPDEGINNSHMVKYITNNETSMKTVEITRSEYNKYLNIYDIFLDTVDKGYLSVNNYKDDYRDYIIYVLKSNVDIDKTKDYLNKEFENLLHLCGMYSKDNKLNIIEDISQSDINPVDKTEVKQDSYNNEYQFESDNSPNYDLKEVLKEFKELMLDSVVFNDETKTEDEVIKFLPKYLKHLIKSKFNLD